jgi:hypothetical protein
MSIDQPQARVPPDRRFRFAVGLASTLIALALAIFSQSSMADMGTCRTAAPTTSSVHVIVSDLDRSVRWYRDHVGLREIRRWNDSSTGRATLVLMERQSAGLTLISYPDLSFHSLDPQMVCFPLEGNPNQSPYLVDPDGTSVELAPAAR